MFSSSFVSSRSVVVFHFPSVEFWTIHLPTFIIKTKNKKRKQTSGTYDEEEVAAELKALIASAPVVVFAWSFSPFSKNARELLDTIGASYEAVELDRVPRGFALKKELSKLTGRSSVPNVFIKGESVGGCYDGPGIVPLYRSGELQEKLRRAGALKKEQKGWPFF